MIKCTHLKGIQFPTCPGTRQIVDMLVAFYCAELHYSFNNVRIRTGGPIRRLTLLGWRCIGTVGVLKGGDYESNFAHAYFVQEGSVPDELTDSHRI